jgi:hypothetical protein
MQTKHTAENTETSAVKDARENELQPYTLYRRSYKSENTPEYGFGDFPETIISPVLSVNAKSLRSAQNQFKKLFGWKRISFSGRFATYFVTQVNEESK